MAKHAQDYAYEEHEAYQEQSYVLHEDQTSYPEHGTNHDDEAVQNVLLNGGQLEEQPEDPEE